MTLSSLLEPPVSRITHYQLCAHCPFCGEVFYKAWMSPQNTYNTSMELAAMKKHQEDCKKRPQLREVPA